MLKKHEQLRVHDLLDAGYSIAEIAKRTGRSLGTIYKYRQLGRNIQGSKAIDKNSHIPKELLLYQNFLDAHIKRGTMNPTALYFTLQQQGYTGSRSVFDFYYRRRRQELNPNKSLKHVESREGEQAQVDWGHFGEITINGKREKVYLFAYILSWSRAMYMEFVVRQNQRTLQACHMHAFEKLGIPKTIIYDNMKTVVSKREKLSDGTKKIHYNPAFLDFAKYYQFEPMACPPYWPRSKGKVEASIKYVRKYFSRSTPRLKTNLEELNTQLSQWVEAEAQQRIHGTTHEKPYDRWIIEKSFLSFPTNLPPYNLSPFLAYYTTQYGILNRNGNTYCLGPEYARTKLEVREIQKYGLPSLEIYRDNKLIKTVVIPAKRHSWVSLNKVAAETAGTLQPIHTKEINPVKRQRRHDIAVEQRDLSYYSVTLRPAAGVSNG